MSAKMWRDADEETKKPFLEMAEEQKKTQTKAIAEWKERADEWDRKATDLKAKYEAEHPPPPATGASGEELEGRRSKKRVESYAESEASDVDMTTS